MATVLSPFSSQERAPHPSGLTLVEPNHLEIPTQPRRLLRHLLVLEPTPLLTYECARAFRAASYAIRPVRSWQRALEWVEQGDIDGILLDLDAIDAAVSRQNVSAHRLVTLLRRVAASQPLTIAAVSQRDFIEVEEALRAGVDVFVGRQSSLLCLIQRIDASRLRRARYVQALAG